MVKSLGRKTVIISCDSKQKTSVICFNFLGVSLKGDNEKTDRFVYLVALVILDEMWETREGWDFISQGTVSMRIV